MPWEVTCVVEERMKFIAAYLKHEWPMAVLCREFGISRKTGYKFVGRYQEDGMTGLQDRSRAPHDNPHAVTEDVAARLLEARRAHPTWGPRKLQAWLQQRHPRIHWPCPSVIGDLLRREGLTVPRRRRQRTPPYSEPFAHCDGPNALWCADFKGWFRTRDGKPCYPFTLSDAHSRFLLRCQALARTDYDAVQPQFEAAFREYGLPLAIRTDNGPPFASVGLGGLSRLAIWWVRLGIAPERIAAGRPEQNGRHERLHRTLKQDVTIPPQATGRAQQRAFDGFRQEYNYERPHQALELAVPASYYCVSARPYPLRLPELTYPDEAEVRRVRHNGEIRWRRQLIYVSQALAGELAGVIAVDDRYSRLCFGPLELGILDSHGYRLIVPSAARKAKRAAGICTAKVLPMSSD
jgi:transposase InsO family protein